MRGKRTDSETKAKVIAAKLINPDLSSRDIASMIPQVSNDTVCDIINKDLPQIATQSETIVKIIENDMQSLKNMSEITRKFTESVKVKENIERSDLQAANQATDSALKRSQLLK
jgi:hypothetical protein